MIILSIETSCDETAISVVKAEGGLDSPSFSVLGNSLYSQIELHKQYGGVYPNLAKREHAKNLIPLMEKVLAEVNSNSKFQIPNYKKISKKEKGEIIKILEREDGLGKATIEFLEKYQSSNGIDLITVTSGPGLEPALWVGISFAKALGLAWNIPVVPTNHMKGHMASVLLKTDEFQNPNFKFQNETKNQKLHVQFPAIALLISGGHTEIVHIEKWGEYKILGQTRDDAVGEAFDKVARMLGLPYPGGPEISKLAEEARKNASKESASSPRLVGVKSAISLPRPMLHSGDLDFSFSGLKTAVLYKIRDVEELNEKTKMEIAREFEDAVVDVLIFKTEKAVLESNAKSLIVAGGVIANKKIRQAFSNLISEKYPEISLFIPEKEMSTDNAVMIAMAGYIEVSLYPELLKKENVLIAKGNLKY